MTEEWLWIGFYIMVLGFILLIPNAFAPCTCPSFGKSTAVIRSNYRYYRRFDGNRISIAINKKKIFQ